jgi:hypothetical protein
MLYQVAFALDNTKKAITLLTEDFIPKVFRLEAFLLKTDGDKYNQSKVIFSDIIGKSLDLEAQTKGTESYIEWIFDDYAKKAANIPDYPLNPTHIEFNDMYSPWWDKFRVSEEAHIALVKTYYPERVNDALQSNFRSMIHLTDDCSGLNVNVLKLEAFILKTFRDENSGLEN